MNDIEAMIESLFRDKNDVSKRFDELVLQHNTPDKKLLIFYTYTHGDNIDAFYIMNIVANSYFEVAGHKCQTLDEAERLIKLKAFL